jgi:hypothetical protein
LGLILESGTSSCIIVVKNESITGIETCVPTSHSRVSGKSFFIRDTLIEEES